MRRAIYRSSLRFVCLFILLVVVQGKDHFESKVTKTVRQTKFYELITEKPIAFVCFWGQQCQDCARLGPAWIEVAELLTTTDVVFFQVDCDVDMRLCRLQSIPNYPTVRVFQNGEFYKLFKGFPLIEMLEDFARTVLAELSQETVQ